METMELNLNEMEGINGGWNWKEGLFAAGLGAIIGATAGGSVGGLPGMIIGGVIGGAAGTVVYILDD